MIDERALRAVIADVVRRVLREERAPPPAGAEYLSVADAARVAAVTPQTIRAWMTAGRLRRYRAGRELRVRRTELDELLAAAPAGDDELLSPELAAVRDLRRKSG